MCDNKLVKDCLSEIDSIYLKFETGLDSQKSALQVQLDRAYASIFASDEAKSIVRNILEEDDIPREILNYIDLKNLHLLKK